MSANCEFVTLDQQQILFAARLTPHRSLNRTGFIVLMTLLSAASFAAGAVFLLMGAWPIFCFFGLDVLLIYWAFKTNFRSAKSYEDITVSDSELRVRRVSHRGHALEWVFNPLWVQIDRRTHEDFGIERLYLISRGRRINVASFLGPDEKESFYKALMAAIEGARRGPNRHSTA